LEYSLLDVDGTIQHIEPLGAGSRIYIGRAEHASVEIVPHPEMVKPQNSLVLVSAGISGDHKNAYSLSLQQFVCD